MAEGRRTGRTAILVGLCAAATAGAVFSAAGALADYAGDVLARCDRVTAPVLCVLSSQDEVIDVPTARAAVTSFASDRKRLLWCNRAAHTILSDTGRERAAREIVEFILSCRDGRRGPGLSSPRDAR